MNSAGSAINCSAWLPFRLLNQISIATVIAARSVKVIGDLLTIGRDGKRINVSDQRAESPDPLGSTAVGAPARVPVAQTLPHSGYSE